MTENQQDFDRVLEVMMGVISDDLKHYAIDEMEQAGWVEERVPGEYVVTALGLEQLRDEP